MGSRLPVQYCMIELLVVYIQFVVQEWAPTVLMGLNLLGSWNGRCSSLLISRSVNLCKFQQDMNSQTYTPASRAAAPQINQQNRFRCEKQWPEKHIQLLALTMVLQQLGEGVCSEVSFYVELQTAHYSDRTGQATGNVHKSHETHPHLAEARPRSRASPLPSAPVWPGRDPACTCYHCTYISRCGRQKTKEKMSELQRLHIWLPMRFNNGIALF